MDAVIGEEPYSTLAIVNAMKEKEVEYSLLLASWEILGENLKINPTKLLLIKHQLSPTFTLDQIPYELLKIWKAQVGSEATVRKLCDTLTLLQHGELSAAIKSLGYGKKGKPDEALPCPISRAELEKLRKMDWDTKSNNDEYDGLPHPRPAVPKDSDVYRIKRTKAGKAIIFNHKNFDWDSNKLYTRHGTDKDVSSLLISLEACGLEVKVHPDLTTKETMRVLHNYSTNYDSDYDCIVVCVLSHGDKDIIYTRDGCYFTSALWSPFEANVCPTLAGKPKLFFIQACRGDKPDGATQLTAFADGATKNESYCIPNKADFLVVYSTAEGTRAFRRSDGTWFIQSLTKVLNEHKNNTDLLSMMTLVARTVAIEYEATVVDGKPCPTAKQVPTLTSTLLRKVYFSQQ